MAKIYETRQDVKHDILADEIKNGERNKETFLGLTAISGLLAALYFEIDSLGNQLLEQARNTRDHVWGSDNIKGWFAVIAGVVSMAMYFIHRNETNNLKSEAEKLGRRNVIFPQHEVTEAKPFSFIDSNNQHVARLENSKENLKHDSLSR